MSKASIFKKSQFHEKLIETGDKLGEFSSKRIEGIMRHFVEKQSSHVRPFIENIDEINRLHNEPIELVFDQENIYLGLVE